jgi:hypothetical protein
MSFGCKLVRGAAKVGEATLRCRSRESDAEEMEEEMEVGQRMLRRTNRGRSRGGILRLSADYGVFQHANEKIGLSLS